MWGLQESEGKCAFIGGREAAEEAAGRGWPRRTREALLPKGVAACSEEKRQTTLADRDTEKPKNACQLTHPRALLSFYLSTNKCIWLPLHFSLLEASVNQRENGQEQAAAGRRNGRPRFFHKAPNHSWTASSPGLCAGIRSHPSPTLHGTGVRAVCKMFLAHPLGILFFFLQHYPWKNILFKIQI